MSNTPPRPGGSSGGGGLPPPPKMMSIRTNTSPPKKKNSNNAPPPPHTVATTLPELESAPPSLNAPPPNSTTNSSSTYYGQDLAAAASEQFQAAVNVLGSNAPSSMVDVLAGVTDTAVDVLSGGGGGYSSGTTTSFVSAAQALDDSTPPPKQRVTTLPLPPPPIRQAGSSFQPTVAPLPPPPPKAASSATSNAAALTPPSATATLPRPPPRQQQQQEGVASAGRTTENTPKSPPPATVATSTTTTTTTIYEPPPRLSRTQFRSTSRQHQLLSVTAHRQTAIPVLLVATESAQQMAWKNGLVLADLLQGLWTTVTTPDTATTGQGGGLPFRSVSRSMTVSWDSLELQFASPDDLQIVPDAVAAERLQQVAALRPSDGNLEQELSLLEDKIDNLLSSNDADSNMENNINNSKTGDLMDAHMAELQKHEQVTKDAYQLTSSLNIPWLWRYRQEADDCTDFLQHDQFQCPAVILTICSTDEQEQGSSNPIDVLRALQSPHYLPVQFRNGMFDPNSVRHEVLVLHDNVAGVQQWDESQLRQQLHRSFGNTSAILRINSLPPETAAIQATEETSDLWGGSGRLGNCLTVADRARIRKYLAHLTTAAVLPALERRIADLNVIVNDRKKGVKNVLKSFWGGARKKEEDDAAEVANVKKTSAASSGSGSDDNNIIKYRYDSVESQVRLLADTLFLMNDYDAAYSMYRLIKDDFKQDKNWMHYASVHEMMALSLYMLDPFGRSREIFGSIENALLSYSRAAEEGSAAQWGEKPGRVNVAPQATRLATRLCLVLTSTRNICSGRHLEVADLLASASSNETALGAAVLLEQSSAHYFKAEMYRKYAFHMLMSGHMFRSAGQENHAFRCFTSALYIYRDGRWEELHNHLRSALAAQLYVMGRMAISLQLYAKLVGTADGGRVSVKSQQKFVHNLLEICNEHPKKALAGADRMAAPSKLSGKERDSVRKERLDRIVQVIRYTRSASRVLELPNIDLPRIDDASVAVLAEEAAHHRQESVPGFGEANLGSEEVWDDLMLKTIAELKALKETNKVAMNKTLSMIEDPDIRLVIALMDKEKANRSMLARTKKSAATDSAPVRALKEPIVVQFVISNPLGLPIDICDIQLVARMTTEDGYRTCTNEDAVNVKPLASSNEKQKWSFQSSDVEFEIADFCRVASETNDSERVAWKSAEDVDPFFVVTKNSMTLEPESQQIASASICPLVMGDLEVVGVRCRLFDDVWVYHPFDIKGPLLQNTRSNRANRVRGESFLLRSKVERGMPCLTADLVPSTSSPSDSNGPALHGQIAKWVLRVSNVGTAAAQNVTLKTNVPWMNIVEEPGRNDKKGDGCSVDETRATSFCLGPTGTHMQIPLTHSLLKTSGCIEPGETFDVPIEIRSSGTGKQDFYMLFRYELVSNVGVEASRRARWLKKMFCVPVYPSLAFSASIAPAFSSKNEHILSIELTNYRTDRPDQLELNLCALTMASRRYRLEAVPGQLGETDGSSPALTLGWQERTTVHYKIVWKEEEKEEEANTLMSNFPLTTSNEPLSAEMAGSPSLLNFLCMERAHEHFEESMKQHQMALARAAAQGDEDTHPRSIASIRRSNTVDTVSSDATGAKNEKEHPTSIARLSPFDGNMESVHLVCSWNGHNGSIGGNHHIRGLAVRPLTNSSSETDCPITITASHPSSVSNDFAAGPAPVPMKVTLRNRLAESPVDFEFAIEQSDALDFTGPETYRSVLGGGEELSIPLKALIPCAGVYNLQRVRLNVHVGEQVSYRFPNQWMVTVDST